MNHDYPALEQLGAFRGAQADPPDANSDSLDLAALIRAEIAASGPLTFARFMELALYHPTLGYYAGGGVGREPVGWSGDYFTSGDLTPLWGHALARRLRWLWEQMGRPPRFEVIEAGAGRGLLGAVVVGDAPAHGPEGACALRYTLVDRAPAGSPLRQAREQRLAQALARSAAPPDAIRWAETLGEVAAPGSVVGCVISNELVDALPTHCVIKQSDALAEVYVALDAAGRLIQRTAAPSTPELAAYLDHYRIPWRRYPDGWRAEVCLLAGPWMREAASLLARGCVMTLDYGAHALRLYTANRLTGTLMAYSHHQLSGDALARPGQQDLTAHVNFSALIEAGRDAGLRLAEDTTQGTLMERLGIWDEADALAAQLYHHAQDRQTGRGQLDYLRRASLRNAVKALLAPNGLGGFRALTMQRGLPGLGQRLAGG